MDERFYPVPAGEGRWYWTTAVLGAAAGAGVLYNKGRIATIAGAVLGAWLGAKYIKAA